MGLHKILKYIAYALGILGAIFALMIIAGSDGGSYAGLIFTVAYIVFALAIMLVLIDVIKGIFSGNIKKTIMTVGVFLAIIVISYVISSGTDLDLNPFNEKGLGITEAISKNVGAGLYTFYFLAIVAIGAMLLSGVKKITNK